MKQVIIGCILLLQSGFAFAQHGHHGQHDTDTAKHMMMDMGNMMSHSYSLSLPMQRNGSGTAWLPDASPMYGYMVHGKKWMYMFHGNLFIRYNKQDVFDKGTRGDAKVDAPNWFMAMAQRPVGRNGLFHASTMFSLDALVAGGSGYPLLFQTGESWNGVPLVDRQHPHDLFSEISIGYTQRLSRMADVYLYIGYPGEPALGSVAFMHRPSALTNPDAPLSHHWNDGTHITFGVATLAFRYGKFKAEVSSFTGREPGEDRYGFDKPLFDSRSLRLSFNPSKEWALQVSRAFVRSPEALHAGEDVDRTTASAIYSTKFGKNKLLNATVLWGLNKTPHHAGEHAVLAEASYMVNKWSLYGRYEWTQKSVEELNLDEQWYGHAAVFPVNAWTLGTAYDILHHTPVRVAAGAQASLYMADKRLNSLYGNTPAAVEIYVRIYPKRMGI